MSVKIKFCVMARDLSNIGIIFKSDLDSATKITTAQDIGLLFNIILKYESM